MKNANSQLETRRQNSLPTIALPRVIVFIVCMALVSGALVPIKTEANHPSASAPQPSPPAEINRIERAATPRAFSYLKISNNPGPANLNLNGDIFLGEQSDGLDPARDRIAIALGSDVVVLEPGSLRPSGQSNRVWTYQNPKHPRLRKVILQRNTAQAWQFEISAQPMSAGNQKVYLRIGNDWGGMDLRTGQLLLQMQPELDLGFQAQATIDSSGGTIQTTNAAGVKIRLEVPPGALAQPTLITMTPLTASPLAGYAKAISPGIKFEPEGLQFAEAATLVFDFSATNQNIGNDHSIFLFTSPLTALPLYGTTDPSAQTLTALVHHFSNMGPGSGDPAYMDLHEWAASLLGTGNLSLYELELLASMVVQDQLTCSQNCIDVARFLQLVSNSIAALVSATCPSSVSNPTDQTLNRLLQLEALGQGLGVDTTALGLRNCMEQVFRALIGVYGSQALIDPSATNLTRLLNSSVRAQQLAFSDLETLALQKLAAALRVLMSRAQQLCPTDRNRALTQFALVQSYLPAVAGVDIALTGDLGVAIANCSGQGGTVIVTGASGEIHAFTSGGNVFPGSTPDEFADGLLTTTTMSASTSQAQGTLAITQPDANTIALDLSVRAQHTFGQDYRDPPTIFGRGSYVRGNFAFSVTPKADGSVRVEYNRGWTTLNPTGFFFAYVRGVGLINRVPPETVDVDTFYVEKNGNYQVSGRFNDQNAFGGLPVMEGQGRLVTITFTPRP